MDRIGPFLYDIIVEKGGLNMYKVKLCLGTNGQFGLKDEEQILLFHKFGFDGFFTGWKKGQNIKKIKGLADSINMIYQSIHAPYLNMDLMWENHEEAKGVIDEMLECLYDCASNKIQVMVMHAFIGFDKHTPNKRGIEHFRIIINEAKRLGVKIAFENTEGEEYLEALMDSFKDNEYVGFCYDSGHELCYNRGKDMISLYGERLIATHLNDNLGVKDFNGNITYLDDLHLLPFDGIANWENIVARLKKVNFNGPLTFELNKLSKPGRHENDEYTKMDINKYLAKAYARACKVGALFTSS
jgi:sugar phosphate isomerase/epimerase